MVRAAGLRQDWIAQRLGLSEPAISLKLSGRRPWRGGEVDRLAELLGVSPAELLEVIDGQH